MVSNRSNRRIRPYGCVHVFLLILCHCRNAWALCVSWVIFACAGGYGGPINTLLSWRAFGPVGRINYSAYLYHMLVIFIITQNMRSPLFYSDYLSATIYLGCLLLSYGVGFIATLWFESPMVGIEKMVFG